MNRDTFIREDSSTIRSKYFTETGMDESLTNFQEPKKHLAGPKPTKPKPVKTRKVPKRIRGQKDIRTVLKSKKELESYAKDFDNVCKHAGLNVDSEELQIAIALSKSLQQTSSDSPQTSQSSIQDRVGKIRTTLLEYGFKVPEIKIKPTVRRRLKKKKNYKLLLTSDEGKQHLIADKYSKVLLQNITVSRTPNTNSDSSIQHLYYLASNAPYSILKSIDTFYVDGLLEKSSSTGNLLRNWAEIPGRPVSPVNCEPNMDFSEIECSQDDLNIILSGSLKSCKNALRSNKKVFEIYESKKDCKVKDSLDNSLVLVNDDETNTSKTSKTINVNLQHLFEKDNTITNDTNTRLNVQKTNELMDSDSEGPIVNESQGRCCSPDLFEDDPSVFDYLDNDLSQKDESNSQNPHVFRDVMDSTDDTVPQNENPGSRLSQNTRCNDFMEITDCVEVQCFNKTIAQFSQDKTKRKFNDLMEITNCVASPVQIDGHIDLTESPENNVNTKIQSPVNETMKDESNVEVLDLNHLLEETICTENYTSGHKGVPEQITTVKTVTDDTNVDLTESPEVANDLANRSAESMDLTQSSNTSDELPVIFLNANERCQSADETILMDPKDYENISKNTAVAKHTDEILDLTQGMPYKALKHNSIAGKNEEILDLTQNLQIVETIDSLPVQSDFNLDLTQNMNRQEVLDLTQEVVFISRNNSRTSETNVSFFEEYVHNHSDNNDGITSDVKFSQGLISEDKSLDVDLAQALNKSTKYDERNEIDLTQSSNSSEDQDLKGKRDFSKGKEHILDSENENDVLDKIISKCSQRCSSLGRKDDVSIDYDELYDNANESSPSKTISKYSTENSTNKDVSNSLQVQSQHSEVFVISDNELDYSIQKSKLEMPTDNFMLGGISIMDELSGLTSFRTNTENNSALANKNTTSDELVEVIIDSNQIENVLTKTPVKHKRLNELATPQATSSGTNRVFTPNNSEYSINTNVTPMPNYESMSLFEIHKELDKFGVKPFKRKRAIQLLSHIYNQTHPTIESLEESPCKRRKPNDCGSPRNVPTNISPRKNVSPIKTVQGKRKEIPRKSKDDEGLINDAIIISQNYEINDIPVIKEVECSSDDWVFQKREKAKVHSCRVPLHIAFHNYVSSRRALREAILCYEPINIDDIHKDLVAYGYRYDPKDLLKFMDKKCITVKTADNDARNHKT